MRIVFFLIGLVMLALGAVGALLPLLPTTPFLLVAAASFARSSPRLDGWLTAHPRFGPLLVAWRERGAIPRSGKWLSALGMLFGYVAFHLGSDPSPLLAAGVAAGFAAIAVYVWSRPE